MSAYYNEFDPYAAQWLRNLIAKNLIPRGEVDERSITEVHPDDLRGFRQCHFFAGIGGWALAARLAGWPDDRELWTGSAPCQPFSVAGKGKAQSDDRHLWPHYFRLISARRPIVCMGEQVAAAVGKDWLDGVAADLEGVGYACGSVVVPACAVNAPHRRDRLWFVARAGAMGDGLGEGLEGHTGHEHGAAGWSEPDRPAASAGSGSHVAQPSGHGYHGAYSDAAKSGGNGPNNGLSVGSSGELCGPWVGGGVADSNRNGREPRNAPAEAAGHGRTAQPVCGPGAWDQAGWVIGHDGKARRVEPGICLLAHGVPARVGRLRAYGNAIVPQVAAEVIGAYMDCFPAVAA